MILDGYRRVDNITDATLASYREHYGDAGITKEDIFFCVYALLHHPEYRERYEDDLKKMLPHIPRAAGFHTYASVGRELADLHVNYERVEPYPSVQEEASLHAPADPWERYRIGERKMRFPKPNQISLPVNPKPSSLRRRGGTSRTVLSSLPVCCLPRFMPE